MAKNGTIYILEGSSRANWLGKLAKFLDLDFDVVEPKSVANFNDEFPLHKIPAIVTDKGVKITEALAIIYYLIAISNKKELYGSNIDETTQVIRWLAFFNQDFLIGLGTWRRSVNDDEKEKKLSILKSYFVYVDNELKSRKYLALPDRITVADIFTYNILKKVSLTLPLTEYQSLSKWLAEIETHPVFKN
ncbi:hypothetical protein C6P42_003662 [Pichia californica]|nr:hypothetical protein C6P42_003662 [[Candida] californica]